MARSEDFIRSSRIESGSEPFTIPGTTIPFCWLQHELISPLIKSSESSFLRESPNILPLSAVPVAVSKALSNQDGLMETINAIFPGKDPTVRQLSAVPIQMGAKAYIVLCRAETTAGNGDFVMHLARNPIDSNGYDEAATDFRNLIEFNASFNQNLNDKAKKKRQYQVMRPYSLLAPVTIDGHQYSSFTMPFVENYGELRVDLSQDPNTGSRFTYFRYALTFSRNLETFNQEAYKRNATIHKNIAHLSRRYPHLPEDQASNHIVRTPEYRVIKQQMGDVLIGNALLFLLSNNSFPKDFMINSGDWMFNHANAALNLYLITIRGGWDLLGSESAWKEKMLDHHEAVPGNEKLGLLMPIFFGQEALINQSLEQAKKLLK